MSRYIDAEDVEKRIDIVMGSEPKAWDKKALRELKMYVVHALPTADVVEVVRCKDCKYTAKGGNESEFWNICTLRPLVYVPVSDEDYCSRGEKKDGGDGQ